MSRIITKNRDPRVNEFGPNDLVLNTTTGDLFLKSQNQLFKVIGRNQFDQSTTDSLLKLLSEASQVAEDTVTGQSAKLTGFDIGVDGLYSIRTSSPRTGSNVSLHGGIPFDYGQPLPNFLSNSEKLFTTVGTNAGPFTVGPTIAAPIAPTP